MVLFIIFGTRTMPFTRETGNFNCPQCGLVRDYRLQVAKQWFTLYFIPLIPMGSQGEYVECSACGGSFGVEILHYDLEEDQAETIALVRRVVLLAMLSAGKADQQYVDALKRLLANVLGAVVAEAELADDARMAKEAGADLATFVSNSAGDFSDSGKLAVLQVTAQVFATAGPLSPADCNVLGQMAQALGFTPDQVEELARDDQLLLAQE